MTRIRKIFCATLCALLITLADARAANYDELILQARTLLEGGRVVDALATSTEATKLNPKGFKGHYYIAMALMSLGRLDDAADAAEQALFLVPDSERAAVEKLYDAVETRQEEAEAEQAASAALAEGLFGKAAPAYEQAWLVGRARPDLGLKAADLYANRLKSPIDAGRVLRQVIDAMPGRPEAELAQTELQKLAPVLRNIAQDHVRAARDSSGDLALRRLEQAEAADPDYPDIFIQRIRIIASGTDGDAMRGALKDLTRLDQATPAVLGDLPAMPQWLERPEIGTYLADLIGRPQVEALGKVLAVKADERRKADEARRAKELKDQQDRLAEKEHERRLEAARQAKEEREIEECQKLVEEMAEYRDEYERISSRVARYKDKIRSLDELIATEIINEQTNQIYFSVRGLHQNDKDRTKAELKSATSEYDNAIGIYRAKLRTYNKKCLSYTDKLILPDKF
jgi:tetratricopeptide (TPR) repeat protein